MEDHKNNILKRLALRIVKRQIAGPTTISALNAISEMNGRGFRATATLLNENADDQVKARYNANAYVQLIRQLSRLHLDSDVSVRLTQVGYRLDRHILERNMDSISEAAEKCRKGIWIEHESGVDSLDRIRMAKSSGKSIGIELDAASPGIERESKMASGVRRIKLIRSDAHKNDRELLKSYGARIPELSKRASLTIVESNPKLISRITSIDKDYKRDLIFEIPLGYSSRKLAALQRAKLNLSVYIPYGKDWMPYLASRFTESRMRRIAVALLYGKNKDVDANAEADKKGAKGA